MSCASHISTCSPDIPAATGNGYRRILSEGIENRDIYGKTDQVCSAACKAEDTVCVWSHRVACVTSVIPRTPRQCYHRGSLVPAGTLGVCRRSVWPSEDPNPQGQPRVGCQDTSPSQGTLSPTFKTRLTIRNSL